MELYIRRVEWVSGQVFSLSMPESRGQPNLFLDSFYFLFIYLVCCTCGDMAQPGREGDGESSVQASLGAVLAAIKDIQRAHGTTVSALGKVI